MPLVQILTRVHTKGAVFRPQQQAQQLQHRQQQVQQLLQ